MTPLPLDQRSIIERLDIFLSSAVDTHTGASKTTTFFQDVGPTLVAGPAGSYTETDREETGGN